MPVAPCTEGCATGDTATVSIEVLSFVRMPGRGRLLAWATVELTVDGVALVLQGITVQRRRDGRMEADLPCCRAPDGGMAPVLALPEELEDAVLRAVLAEVAPGGITMPVHREV